MSSLYSIVYIWTAGVCCVIPEVFLVTPCTIGCRVIVCLSGQLFDLWVSNNQLGRCSQISLLSRCRHSASVCAGGLVTRGNFFLHTWIKSWLPVIIIIIIVGVIIWWCCRGRCWGFDSSCCGCSSIRSCCWWRSWSWYYWSLLSLKVTEHEVWSEAGAGRAGHHVGPVTSGQITQQLFSNIVS